MPDYRSVAKQKALKYGIDPNIFVRQISQESGFDPTARSSAGALGIAQIVPRWHPGVDPLNPIAALDYAAKHDATLLNKYGGDWRQVLSVYNSGQPDKWADPNFAGGQTYNYVRNILSGGGGAAPAAPAGAAPASMVPAATPSTAPRQANPVLQALITEVLGPRPDPTEALLGSFAASRSLAQAPPMMPAAAPPATVPSAGPPTVGVPGRGIAGAPRKGIAEAFYDPLGSYDVGKFGGPIGGHSDHVHVSADDPNTMLNAIRTAQSMGLAVRENPYVDPVDPVHTQGSYHYRTFPGLYQGKSLGMGIDVSGDPDKMAAFYRAMVGQR